MEELIKALKLIKVTCEEQEDCRDCPLGCQDDDCLINGCLPGEWNIADEPIVIIRVMR